MSAFINGRAIFGAAAALIAAAPLCVGPRSLGAQQRADSLAPRKDSSAELRAGVHQAIVLGTTGRSYRIGDTTVSERVGGMTYTMSSARFRLRLEGSVLRYDAFSDTISGSLPGSARFDFIPLYGDTVTVFARTATRPGALDARQTEALGNAGTSTLDLDAFQLGTPVVGGGGVALAYPVGSLVLGVRGGLEFEPKPSGTSPVYWRGTTVKGGVSLTGASGDNQLTASVNLSRSSGDSLGGRNLFPGGGTLSMQLVTDLSAPNLVDPMDEPWPFRAAVFFSQPFNDTRNNQTDRLVPRGSVFGGLASILVPAGPAILTPSVQILRESSSDAISQSLSRNRIDAGGWTASFGLGASLPLGNHLDLDPEAGYTVGNVGATFSETIIGPGGRPISSASRFSDSIRGSWLTLEVRASF